MFEPVALAALMMDAGLGWPGWLHHTDDRKVDSEVCGIGGGGSVQSNGGALGIEKRSSPQKQRLSMPDDQQQAAATLNAAKQDDRNIKNKKVAV